MDGFSAVVARARSVRVEYLNERAKAKSLEASGWYARILQHEIDHMRARFQIDRMESGTSTSIENWKRFRKDKPLAENPRDFSRNIKGCKSCESTIHSSRQLHHGWNRRSLRSV